MREQQFGKKQSIQGIEALNYRVNIWHKQKLSEGQYDGCLLCHGDVCHVYLIV